MDKAAAIEAEFASWADSYGKIKYSFWEGDVSREHREAQQKALALLRPRKGETILDAGCGVGWGTIDAAVKVKPGIAYGIDLTKEMITTARKHARKVGVTNVRFKKCSVLALPFDNAYFNHAFTTHAAHHFYKPVTMLRELHRVIRPGGRFVLVDVCGSTRYMKEFEKKLRREEPAHYKFFMLREAKELLRRAGFTNVEGYRRDHLMYLTARA